MNSFKLFRTICRSTGIFRNSYFNFMSCRLDDVCIEPSRKEFPLEQYNYLVTVWCIFSCDSSAAYCSEDEKVRNSRLCQCILHSINGATLSFFRVIKQNKELLCSAIFQYRPQSESLWGIFLLNPFLHHKKTTTKCVTRTLTTKSDSIIPAIIRIGQ